MGEVWAQLRATLAKLRQQTSAKTYEVFWWRFFWREGSKEVATALELSPHEVQCRYYRARRKWRALTKGAMLLRDVMNLAEPLETPPAESAR